MSGEWELGPFVPHQGVVMTSRPDSRFTCPVLGAEVAWGDKDVFNPGAVLLDGRVHLLIRAEDRVGRFSGTSRIGLAVSDDGFDFELEPEPVLYPDDDRWQAWEWPGGCEDPRVVESPDGGFVCLYTAFDGKVGTLFVATSDDLHHWDKHGPAFSDTPFAMRSSKSGAVVTEAESGRLLAARVDGRYWMYWGEGTGYAATSDDLVHWSPVDFDPTGDRYLTYDGAADQRWDLNFVPGQRVLRPVLSPRRHRFDSLLVEPGPPALRTRAGIVLIYNGGNHFEDGDPSLPALSYQPGQALFDGADPAAVIARATGPFLRADAVDASEGQVGNVCFAQSLVLVDHTWHLYFGMADSRIGCATAPAPGF